MVSNRPSELSDDAVDGAGDFFGPQTARLAPLTGRDHEVNLLKDRWELAQEGMGQVVTLIGEPGLGKSRLVHTLKEHVLGQMIEGEVDAPVIEWRCSPHYQNTGLHPAIDFYQRALNFGPDVPAQVRFERMLTRLEAYELAQPESVPIWASLLGLQTPDRFPPLNLPPTRQREATFGVMREWLHRRAARKPVLFIVEDLHWVDASTLEFIGRFLAEGLHDRVLTLLTFRPEFKTPWPVMPHQTSLALNRLTRRQVGELLSKKAGGALPQQLIEQIHQRTGGVPLFVEELARMVQESRRIDRAEEANTRRDELGLAMPGTLQDLVVSRLDSMTSNPEVAQIAATLGREFAYEVLAAVATVSEATLKDELAILVRSEILYQKGTPPRATYMFKHALLEGALHEALATEKRQQFHLNIAEALESRFPETAQTLPELLAHHFTEAGMTENAVTYWLKAGQRSRERSAFCETIGHLTKGLALLDILEESPARDNQELLLLTTLAPAYIAARGYAAPEVGPILVRARELCQRIGDRQRQFGIMLGMWEWRIVRGDLRVSADLAADGMALAESLNDPGIWMEALFMPGVTMFYRAQFAGARACYENALGAYDDRERTKLWSTYSGHDAGVTHRCYLALALWHLGYPDQALKLAGETCDLARTIGHPFSLEHAVDFAAFLHHYCRLGTEVKALAEEETTIATDQGFPFWHALGTLHKGAGLLLQGRPEEGLTVLLKGFSAFRATGAEVRVPSYLGLVGDAYMQSARFAEARQALDEGLAVAEKNDDRCHEAELYRLKGELLLAESRDETAAEQFFRRAIETARRQRSRAWELRATTSLARLWHRQGRRSESLAALAAIYGTFTEGFSTPDLVTAKALLDALGNERMQDEFAAGAKYVLGCIPAPMDGPVAIDWRYIPSSSLGGDTIGYYWIDDDHLALYLIDVTGHGLDSALLSVTITNVLRSGSLPGADMRQPGEVLAKLNDAFQSDMHSGKFFTIWYGVYQPSNRALAWSGGGHHPAILLGGREPVGLEATGPIMGAVRGMEFAAESCSVSADARLLIFSDGVFEILRADHLVWNLRGCTEYLAAEGAWQKSEVPLMDRLLAHVRGLRGTTLLDDDFSFIDVRFR